jgi:hypothetical protein
MTLEAHSKSRTRKWPLMVGAAVLGIGALSYAWYDYRFPSWKEEVLLPDGRKIVVMQRRDFIKGYGTRKTWLTFSLPEMGGEQTWAEYMQPVLVGVSKDGQVYVVGWPSGQKQMGMYRHPRYGYAAFRWTPTGFERVPFISIPEDLRQEENLIRCLPKPQFAKWETKLQAGCNEGGEYVVGGSRKIDIRRMQEWALKQAERQNIKPLSE